MKIGILALQGDFQRHGEHISRLGLTPNYVRSPNEIAGIDGLIIPGGESTTIGKLIQDYGLDAPLKKRIAEGMPVFGTCAGMILLAREIEGRQQFTLDALDITVARNAYGRQIASFEADFFHSMPTPTPIHGVFIRAPRITRLGSGVQVLASFEDIPVLIQENNLIAASFHPELTDNLEIHRYFITMITSREETRV